MPFTDEEILETVRMFELETFDIRTTTFGISLLDCADPDLLRLDSVDMATPLRHIRQLLTDAEHDASLVRDAAMSDVVLTLACLQLARALERRRCDGADTDEVVWLHHLQTPAGSAGVRSLTPAPTDAEGVTLWSHGVVFLHDDPPDGQTIVATGHWVLLSGHRKSGELQVRDSLRQYTRRQPHRIAHLELMGAKLLRRQSSAG